MSLTWPSLWYGWLSLGWTYPAGDMSFVLGQRVQSLYCRENPSDLVCQANLARFTGDSPNNTDLVLEVQMEVDQQWGPYLCVGPRFLVPPPLSLSPPLSLPRPLPSKKQQQNNNNTYTISAASLRLIWLAPVRPLCSHIRCPPPGPVDPSLAGFATRTTTAFRPATGPASRRSSSRTDRSTPTQHVLPVVPKHPAPGD